jgi:hypothetical protein
MVTNLVLLISDTDVVFSCLFARQLVILGGIYNFFLAVMIGGLATYFAGILYFGPRNKFRTVKLLKQMMHASPGEFKSPKTKNRVDCASSIYPERRTLGLKDKTFGQCGSDQEGLDAMEAGLSAYGLNHMFAYASIKTACNTCEMKHGVPFLRLARFGFIASPSPADLGGILNANALYSFSTGIFQIAIGVMILATTEEWQNLFVLLPLGISGFSLVLSLFNVLLDFSGMLNEAEKEKRMRDEIIQNGEAKRQEQRAKIEKDMQNEIAQIDTYYQNKTGAADITEKQQKKRDVTNNHFLNIAEIERTELELLRAEIHLYRGRLQGIKDAMSGKHHVDVQQQSAGSMAEFERRKEPFEKQKDAIGRDAQERIAALDPTSMTPTEFETQMDQITADANKKIALLDKQLELITLKFRGAPGVPDGKDSTPSAPQVQV